MRSDSIAYWTGGSSAWPSMSMKKQYSPRRSFVGLLSSFVKLICRSLNSCKMASSDPGLSFSMKQTTLVLSVPVGAVLAGDAPGRPGTEAVTLFDSTGLAIQDLAIAGAALEAWRAGQVRGQTVRL